MAEDDRAAHGEADRPDRAVAQPPGPGDGGGEVEHLSVADGRAAAGGSVSAERKGDHRPVTAEDGRGPADVRPAGAAGEAVGDDGDRHPPGRVMGHIRVKIGGLVDGLDGDPVGRQQHHPFGPFGETVLTCGKGGRPGAASTAAGPGLRPVRTALRGHSGGGRRGVRAHAAPCRRRTHVGYCAGKRTRAATPPGPFVLSGTLYTTGTPGRVLRSGKPAVPRARGSWTYPYAVPQVRPARHSGRTPSRREPRRNRRHGRTIQPPPSELPRLPPRGG